MEILREGLKKRIKFESEEKKLEYTKNRIQ